jgi:hypothetical protein
VAEVLERALDVALDPRERAEFHLRLAERLLRHPGLREGVGGRS